MNFHELILRRQSCRSFDETRDVEEEKIRKIMESAILAPSACNGQPYHFTVCRGESAKKVAITSTDAGNNLFSSKAPVVIVVSEEPYVERAGYGAKVKNNDYRSMDIGLATAHLILAAEDAGLATCIIGWFDNEKVKEICNVSGDIRLLILLGYAENTIVRKKVRKDYDTLVSYVE